jgi:hypothetical protein
MELLKKGYFGATQKQILQMSAPPKIIILPKPVTGITEQHESSPGTDFRVDYPNHRYE